MKKIKLFNLDISFILGIVLGIISSLVSILVPLVIRKAIDLKHLVNHEVKYSVIMIIIVLLVLSLIITALSNFLLSRSGDQQIMRIRLQVQSHLIYLPLSFFDNQTSGQLASRVINDASVVKEFITTTIPTNINSFIMTIGILGILIVLDWKLTLLILLCFPLDAMVTIPLGRITEKLSVSSQTMLSKLTGLSSESLENIRSVKLNTAEHAIIDKFENYVSNLYHLSIKADGIFAIASPVQSFFSFVIILGIILYGGFRVTSGTLTFGTLVSFLIYFYQVVGPINNLATFYSDYKQAHGATKEITKIINVPCESEIELPTKTRLLKRVNVSSLKLENIGFTYGAKEILKNINMTFEVSKKIAIVGPSGAGKTTIINLLTRLYDPSYGKIVMGKTDASDYKLSTWRNLFSVVTQENTIFAGTIYDNLTFGLLNSPTEQQIQTSLQMADLWEEVQQMPQKIQTKIGEHGVKLSGGQRQRLQIAHAFLKNSPFLILDEATSNLDADAERSISTAIKRISHGKTIIAVAHRLSTIIDADKIYFLDKHIILAQGTHQELLKKLPAYKRFVNEQMLTTE